MTVEVCRTKIRLEVSFVALICLMLVFCKNTTVVMSLICSAFHECGHLVMMCIFKDAPEKVTMGAFGMRIDRRSGKLSYKQEALVCMGGIIVNIILAVTCFTVYFFSGYMWAIEAALINIFIALINMMPVGMLDFSRALSCFLYMKCEIKKAQKISEIISAIFLAVFVSFCVLYCFFVKVNLSLVAVTVYLVTSYKKRS